MGNFTLLLILAFYKTYNPIKDSHRRPLLTPTFRRNIKPSKLGECITLESSKFQIPNAVPRWYFALKVGNW
jgi:hypothetical protein